METDGSFKKSDVYARVTDEIVRAIEAGVKDYEMPWHQRAGAGLPRNASTGNFYRGGNTVASVGHRTASRLCPTVLGDLPAVGKARRPNSARRKGVGRRLLQAEESATDDEVLKGAGESRRILRGSFVFNAEQVDGWTHPEPASEDRTEKLRRVDRLIESLGADIRYGSNMAYYSKMFDRINMPNRREFIDRATSSATEGFYSVLLHEHMHWTGHTKRLNRDLSGRFGDSAYAMEELVAELGAAFLCADLGISVQPRRDHAAYVASWLQVLRQQKAAIFTAASTATAGRS